MMPNGATPRDERALKHLSEIRPRTRLDGLILDVSVRDAFAELVLEQREAERLAAEGLAPRVGSN